jgi:tetratricopeptide (TPR) repeat protein
MIPFERNLRFVGRQDEIQKLEDLISVPDGEKKLAITGLGGVGKTQIALELAYRMRDREPECSIFWIPCTSYEAIEQAYMSIAQMVGLHDVEPAEVKERLRTYFSQTKEKWLLIFDNADEMNMWIKGNSPTPPLKNIIPWSENGHVLFTSRNRQLALKLASSNVLSVPNVDQRTAKEILRKLLIRNDLFQDDHVTSALLEQLAFLPLAISQAAAYINQNDISLVRYISLLNEQEGSTIEMLSEDFEDGSRYAEIQNSVATTWLVSFLQIQQVNEIASDLLSFMACISPRDIPESILPSTTTEKRKQEALGLLKAYSFISAQVDDSVLSLHRLVHLATRSWLRKKKTFETWVETAAEQLDRTFPDDNPGNRSMWRNYLPHALYLVNNTEFQDHQTNHDGFLARIGSCLNSDGRYMESETLFRIVLKIRERVWGLEHPNTLISVSHLGSVLAQQGKYKEAEAMYRQVLKGYEKALGPEHPLTLISVSHLGSVLAQQGKYKEAEAMHRQTLKSREKTLGPEHPVTLINISHLGSVLALYGKYEEAEAMHRQVLKSREKALGPEHPLTLISVSHLGSVLAQQGKYKEAEAMHRQTLKSREKALDSEHPDTLTSVSNLRLVLAQQGKYKEAEAMHRQVLKSREKALDSEHPDTLTSVSNLGSVLARQGKYEEAEAMHRQALKGYRKALGPEHPHTLTSMHNLAFTLEQLGKISDALSLMKKSVNLRNKVSGSNHPDAISSSNALRNWETAANQLSERQNHQSSADYSPTHDAHLCR